jgi:hypothetical protein
VEELSAKEVGSSRMLYSVPLSFWHVRYQRTSLQKDGQWKCPYLICPHSIDDILYPHQKVQALALELRGELRVGHCFQHPKHSCSCPAVPCSMRKLSIAEAQVMRTANLSPNVCHLAKYQGRHVSTNHCRPVGNYDISVSDRMQFAARRSLRSRLVMPRNMQ